MDGRVSYRSLSKTSSSLQTIRPSIASCWTSIRRGGIRDRVAVSCASRSTKPAKQKNIVAVLTDVAVSAALASVCGSKNSSGESQVAMSGSLGSVTWLESWTEAYKMLESTSALFTSDPDATRLRLGQRSQSVKMQKLMPRKLWRRRLNEFIEDMAKYCCCVREGCAREVWWRSHDLRYRSGGRWLLNGSSRSTSC